MTAGSFKNASLPMIRYTIYATLSGKVLFGLQYYVINDSVRQMNINQQGGSTCKFSSGNIVQGFMQSGSWSGIGNKFKISFTGAKQNSRPPNMICKYFHKYFFKNTHLSFNGKLFDFSVFTGFIIFRELSLGKIPYKVLIFIVNEIGDTPPGLWRTKKSKVKSPSF